MKDDVNAWESSQIPLTENEKKEAARQRIESELEGNPNLPKRKVRKLKFAPPDKLSQERMQYLDRMGNPIKGYKWSRLDIVEEATNQIVFKSPIPDIDSTEKQLMEVTVKSIW